MELPRRDGHELATDAGARVLVIDADASSAEAMSTALRASGFLTRTAESGRAGERAIDEFRPDLIVLEAVLPDVDGFEVARRLASTDDGRMPVMFVTVRAATPDRISGLAVADDYVTKPVSPAEIVARARAILRRTRGGSDGAVRFADVVLSERTHEVRRGGQLVELTPTEFNLLHFFMLNPRRVLTKRQILENVWNDNDLGGDASLVETYVSYLRKKLDRLGPPLIHTIRLVGYALRES